ncbi:hypothetical protein KCP74_07745 [Salmonella enterica subsp. enterica]|nr:hypothetical protein KCP74_07745 [Salmonella enterica subsp. enterica]
MPNGDQNNISGLQIALLSNNCAQSAEQYVCISGHSTVYHRSYAHLRQRQSACNQCVSNEKARLSNRYSAAVAQTHIRARQSRRCVRVKAALLCINYSVATSLGVINTTNSRRSSSLPSWRKS